MLLTKVQGVALTQLTEVVVGLDLVDYGANNLEGAAFLTIFGGNGKADPALA